MDEMVCYIRILELSLDNLCHHDADLTNSETGSKSLHEKLTQLRSSIRRRVTEMDSRGLNRHIMHTDSEGDAIVREGIQNSYGLHYCCHIL
jgi:hypothetical protein